MKLIKQLEEQRNLDVAKRKVYKNVTFTNGFAQFLESLVINNLVTEQQRTWLSDKIVWADEVRKGGILFETSVHPFFNDRAKEFAGDVTVVGSADAITMIDHLFEMHDVDFEGASKPQHVEIKHQYHDTLNPKFWQDKQLDPDVKKALKRNADEFKKFLKMPGLVIEDITLTGSNANYNWTDESDLDLHLLVDVKKTEEKFGPLVKEYFEAKKKVWNDLHNIQMKGHDVEFYVQDVDEAHHSTGIYSLQDDKWLVEPEHKEPSVDNDAVKAKAARLMKEIDEVTGTCNKAAAVEALMEKIKKMRKAGVAEAGEFSTENLVFKVLRSNGYLEKLAECKTRAFDRELSIEEEEWNFEDEGVESKYLDKEGRYIPAHQRRDWTKSQSPSEPGSTFRREEEMRARMAARRK